MGRAKLHVVPNMQAALEAEGPVSKPVAKSSSEALHVADASPLSATAPIPKAPAVQAPAVQAPKAPRSKSKAPKKPAHASVAELMQRDVASCRPYEPLNTVGRLMWDRDVGAVVIVDEQLRPVSMVTDRDVAMAAYTQGATLANIGVRSCMSQRMITCSDDSTPQQALQLMQEHRVRRLPVTDSEGKLVGIIGFGDIKKAVDDKKLKTGVKATDLAVALSKILE